MLGSFVTAKVVSTVASVALSVGGTAAAVTGNLPAPVQDSVAGLVAQAGVTIPHNEDKLLVRAQSETERAQAPSEAAESEDGETAPGEGEHGGEPEGEHTSPPTTEAPEEPEGPELEHGVGAGHEHHEGEAHEAGSHRQRGKTHPATTAPGQEVAKVRSGGKAGPKTEGERGKKRDDSTTEPAGKKGEDKPKPGEGDGSAKQKGGGSGSGSGAGSGSGKGKHGGKAD